MEIAVKDIQGKETGKKVTLDDSVFGIEPNEHAVYLDVKAILANKRQGTHASKEKSMLSGSTKKLKRQKGTGGARAGSIKNPLFRGGARVFGPQPRDYSEKVNKQVKALARKSALSAKVKDNEVIVVEDFSFEAPKTKQMVEFKKNFNLDDKNSLLVVANPNKNVYLSARNLQGFSVVSACDLNTYEILKAKNLILCEGSVEEIVKTLKK
ncbi:MAG: 50S ribosomal protein L4 [Bacteroidales bacterium]|jgi:large subunit ribosomal protein L4|nr:50S ribosomal protein L4 [Bacteroidales bacterium]MBQ3675867.1 50S ribosomal protein L4 [Bacteroidales bacterium]MBQ4214772.1 50S ribosomal protein L4 [Bacteroidales bacterium]MBR4498643.1 50S ribosomal protein L4 [Bacteroidales bacterium]MBR4690773.1 50S ribosomal protein L4 [Bacteroidales bacterium]